MLPALTEVCVVPPDKWREQTSIRPRFCWVPASCCTVQWFHLQGFSWMCNVVSCSYTLDLLRCHCRINEISAACFDFTRSSSGRYFYVTAALGRAIAQAVSRGGPSSWPGLVMWDLWWTKWRWGRFSSSTSVSPANLHSTDCSTITIIYHLGLVQ
jgi:hypothetical protein